MISRIRIWAVVVANLFFLATPAYASLSYGDADGSLGVVVERTGVRQTDIKTASGEIIKAALGILGLIFFVLLIYAGITWMTARGDEDAVTKARETIFAAVIGLSVVLASYAITSFLTTRILSGSPDAGATVSGGGTLGDEPLGCCIDWGEGGAFEEYGVPAYRITTIGDCQTQGEANEPSGYSCVGPKIGCWTFQTGLLDVNQCRAANEQ